MYYGITMFRLLLIITVLVQKSEGYAVGERAKAWIPHDFIATFRNNGLDPTQIYYILEAMKHKTADDVKNLINEYGIQPSKIRNVLSQLQMSVFDAYYALKQWVGTKFSDNVSSDPTFHRLSLFEAFRAMQLMKYSDKEMDDEFNIIFERSPQTTVRPLLSVNVYKLIENFFEKDNYYTNWKTLFPNAFRALKRMYDNKNSWAPPSGVSMFTKAPSAGSSNDCCGGTGHANPNEEGKEYYALHQTEIPQGFTYVDTHPQTPPPPPFKQDQYDLYDPKYTNDKRYFLLHDEMHVYNKMKDHKEDAPAQTIHHVRRFYDKIDRIVIESSKTIEHHYLDNGSYRKVRTDITKYNPNELPGRDYMRKYYEAQSNI